MFRQSGTGAARTAAAALLLVLAAQAFGLNCTTQSQMTADQRNTLRLASMALAEHVQSGDANAVKAQTIPALAEKFDPIAASIEAVNPALQHADLTLNAMYLLDATDLKSTQEADFFCGLPASTLTVQINISDLPPGKYALAVMHATGVKNAQSLSMVLANDPAGSAAWKLAGFFTRPMTMGGHDGLWFWKQARDYAAKKQAWDAWFYYQTAAFLLDPVDFLSSPNLQKLHREAEQTRPEDLPGADPMHLTSGSQTWNVTSLHTGELADQLDLVVNYQAQPNQDPVAAREQVTSVMRALLNAHPELAAAFHGLWVYADTGNSQHSFALELPISQIQSNNPSPGQRAQPNNNQGN
jgi:hypothetical protein